MSREGLVRVLVPGLGTVVSIVLIVLVVRATPSRPREKSPSHVLPQAQPWGEDGPSLASRRVDRAPPPLGATESEDDAVLRDPASHFGSSFHVVMASLEREPKERSCILEPASGGDQRVLSPGDRLQGYLLLAIDPVNRKPRSVRLTFREERRAADFEVVLDPK